MIIQVSKMKKLREPLAIEDQMNIEALVQLRRDLLAVKPLDVKLKAQYESGGMIGVTGTLQTEVVMSCSRCLNKTVYPLDLVFHERFTQGLEETDHDDEEEDIIYIESDRIDLKPHIEENVLLALPFIPLCDEQCKGLCPVCGTNRNEISCGCSTEKIDPRLAALADLKNQMPNLK